MDEGIDENVDEIDDIDDDFVEDVVDDNSGTSDDATEQSDSEEDVVTSLLRNRGIDDTSKIKFENEEGEIEEKDWSELSNSDKLNILESSETTPEEGLDDSEIQLINAIRNSGMSPAEYLTYVGTNSIGQYVQNNTSPEFEIDQYTDDELFLMDIMSRTGDITQDEALEALEKAKANESLYQKQVNSIRNEYKQAEQENQLQLQIEQDQQQQIEREQFSNQIVDEINNLREVEGFELNMDDNDMQTLYDFITGEDQAGNNYLVKALADPRILVKTAWLALNGDQMVRDITNYFQKEISNVRKASYKKGVEDTQNKINKPNNFTYKSKSKSNNSEYYSDLDDF